LIDTDGYLCKRQGYSICTKSKQLADDILFLVYSLGGRGHISKIRKGIKRINFIGEYYNVQFYLGNLDLPLRIQRKILNKTFFYLSANRLSIGLKKGAGQMVYGFTLDSPSHWYITDNWCITHNSTIACQVACVLDPTFCVDRIVFTADQFIKAVQLATKGQAVVFDEAASYLSSRQALSRFNRALIKVMAEMGFKNLFILNEASRSGHKVPFSRSSRCCLHK
jgi:hypothetical protein